MLPQKKVFLCNIASHLLLHSSEHTNSNPQGLHKIVIQLLLLLLLAVVVVVLVAVVFRNNQSNKNNQANKLRKGNLLIKRSM